MSEIMKKKAAEKAEHLKKAQAIIDGAKADGDRDLTADEQKQFKSHADRAEAIIKWEEGAKASDALMATICAAGAGEPVGENIPGYDPEAIKDGLSRAMQTKGQYAFQMPFVKAALTAGGASLPSAGEYVSDPVPGTGVVALREFLDLQQAASPNIRYYSIGSGSAGNVSEGALKPELGASITPHDAALQKIAAWFEITDELAEDAPFLVRHVQAEAIRAVLVQENVNVVAALEGAVGALTAGGPVADGLDVLAEAIGVTEAANGITPSRVVLNPVDLAGLRQAKATTSGVYHADPLAAGPTTIHGVPLVSTPAVPEGRAFLMSPGVGQFYVRGGLRVEAGHTGDNFIRNTATIRVEERCLPVVTKASLLTKITFGDGPAEESSSSS